MLAFHQSNAEVYYPEISGDETALSQTTHLGIGAHQDDLEIFAIHGILTAYDDPAANFTGVTVTDGRGAPRSGPYASLSDDELWQVRTTEQKKAAEIGHYLAQILLNYASVEIKTAQRREAIEDLKQIIQITRPDIIYTHNPIDQHDTHVAVSLAVIQACRELQLQLPAVTLYGCEVWRSLDWLAPEDKVAFNVSAHPELQAALLSVFESQIVGGKRYDLATIGRRQANATYDESHATDEADRLAYALDLTPLMRHPELDIADYINDRVQNLAKDARDRLSRLKIESGKS